MTDDCRPCALRGQLWSQSPPPAWNNPRPDGPPERPEITRSVEAYHCRDDGERIILRQFVKIRLDGSDILESSRPGVLGLGDAAEVDGGIETDTASRKRRSPRVSPPLALSSGDRARHDVENAVAGMSDEVKDQNV